MGYERKDDGTTPSDKIGKRREVKRRLRKDYEDAGHDIGPMVWVSRHRNASAHEHYFFADVVQGAGEVVFTQTSDDFPSMDHTNPEALTARRLIQAARSLQGFIGWFVAESGRQAHLAKGVRSNPAQVVQHGGDHERLGPPGELRRPRARGRQGPVRANQGTV